MNNWRYKSSNTVEYIYLHDCDCKRIYANEDKISMEMEWMEVFNG